MASGTKAPKPPKSKIAKNYRHPESESLMRPEVGTQAQFKKKLPPKKYRYDDSLSPALDWDGQNPARERGEAHLAVAEANLAKARETLAAADPAKITREKLEQLSGAVAFRAGGRAPAQGDEQAFSELGGQGRAAVV
jgi:hypothetical protein